MENLRKYSLAADFIEAGAAGTDASDQQAYASLMRKAQLHEQLQPPNDAAGTALQFLLLEQDPDLTIDELRAISSRNGAKIRPSTLTGRKKDRREEIQREWSGARPPAASTQWT